MKLYMYGITGKTHRWIEDFLGNRTQEVVDNWSKSECIMIKSGVPQGKVHSTSSFILMTLNRKSPVLYTFLLMIMPFTDQYILKVTPLFYKRIYSSCRRGQINGI